MRSARSSEAAAFTRRPAAASARAPSRSPAIARFSVRAAGAGKGGAGSGTGAPGSGCLTAAQPATAIARNANRVLIGPYFSLLLPSKQALHPALRLLLHSFDRDAQGRRAGSALRGRRALRERQLHGARARVIRAPSALRIDEHVLDTVRLGPRQRLRSERGHHLAPRRQRRARAREARRAVVVVAYPHDAEPVAGESREPGVALLGRGAGLARDGCVKRHP